VGVVDGVGVILAVATEDAVATGDLVATVDAVTTVDAVATGDLVAVTAADDVADDVAEALEEAEAEAEAEEVAEEVAEAEALEEAVAVAYPDPDSDLAPVILGYAVGAGYDVKVDRLDLVIFPLPVRVGYIENDETDESVGNTHAEVGLGKGPASAICAAATV